MGNTQSQNQKSLIINHPKFTSTLLSKDSKQMIITLSIQNDIDFHVWQKKLNLLTKIDDETYLLPKSYQFKMKPICGNSGTLKISYDYYPYILIDEINNRKQLKKYFQEEQMWYLLYCLVCCAWRFGKIGPKSGEISNIIKVGDIRPENIFIDEDGQVKVSNVCSWPYQLTNRQKTQRDRIITYLSPEQLDEIRIGKVEAIINKVKAQSFSIGLTMIHVGLLEQVKNLYNLSTLSIDINNLKHKLQKWLQLILTDQSQQKQIEYSPQLKDIIYGLCEIDPKKRISSYDVYEWLKDYDYQIVNFKHFKFQKLPIPRQSNKNKQKSAQSKQRQTISNQTNHRPKQQIYKTLVPHSPFKEKRQALNYNSKTGYSQEKIISIGGKNHHNSRYNNDYTQANQRSLHLQPGNFKIHNINPKREREKTIPKYIYPQQQPKIYQKSIQTNNSIPKSNKFESTKQSAGSSTDILKIIDQQLKKSKQLYR